MPEIDEMFPEDKSSDSQLKNKLEEEHKEKIKKDEKLKRISKDLDFDLEKVSDIGYLKDIFSPKFDSYKSQEYLMKTRKKLIKDNYPESPALNEYLFWLTISRRLQIMYQRLHAQLMSQDDIKDSGKEDLSLLKEMGAITDKVARLQMVLETSRDKKEKISDMVDLFSATMKETEEFVKDNIGEFSFSCSQCGTIVQADGLPHFAIMTETDEKRNKIYHIYSPELAFLVKEKIISLYLMAFILRTSPEGITHTAKARNEDLKPLLDGTSLEEEEEKLKELKGKFEDV